MVYNGENYYYVKNTLGDIIAIRNSAGTEVASYNYDAWGNVIDKYGTMADINPFRYRGYYYDVETGFYYLQTRYYDPTTRLFINADNYELISTLAETPGQLNMYGYCNNNPIMFTDETGELALTTILTFIAVVGLSALDGAVCAYLNGENWIIGGAIGALAGVAGFFVGQWNPVVGRFVNSLIYDVANPLFQHGDYGEADFVNTLIDISLDISLSCFYSPFMAKGRSRFLLGTISASIDSTIDILQTKYIYKPISESFNKTLGAIHISYNGER